MKSLGKKNTSTKVIVITVVTLLVTVLLCQVDVRNNFLVSTCLVNKQITTFVNGLWKATTIIMLTDEPLTEFISRALGFPNLASKGTFGLNGSVEATICNKWVRWILALTRKWQYLKHTCLHVPRQCKQNEKKRF